MSLAHVFAAPLRFGKYGRATFFEVNVICLVVMYTDKVLRPCHMLMLDNTFWAERLTVGGGRGGWGALVEGWRRRRRRWATDGQSLPLQSKVVLMPAGYSLVILGSTNPPAAHPVLDSTRSRPRGGAARWPPHWVVAGG